MVTTALRQLTQNDDRTMLKLDPYIVHAEHRVINLP